MEKTLREELEDAFDIARIEGMLHSKDGKHSLSSEADAEGIIEFISQHIKAKALKDEELIEAINSPYGKNMYEQVTKGDRAVAAAQLQAVLKELE